MPRRRTLEISHSFESNLSDVTLESSLRRSWQMSKYTEDVDLADFVVLKAEYSYKLKVIHFLMCVCIVLGVTLMQQIFKNMKGEADDEYTLHIFETSFNLGSICMTFRTVASLSVCAEDEHVSPMEWIE